MSGPTADLDSPAVRERVARTCRLRHAVAELNRRNAAATRDFLRQRNLTEPLSSALWAIDAPVSLTEMARRLNCQKQNVTQIADKLESLGLVRRSPHPTDRRVTLLTLTDAGAAIRVEVGEHLWGGYATAILDDPELEAFEALLDRLLGTEGDAAR